ncbi:Uma2 family endonuclease [Dolichospermum sp. ST_sed1]|nr:Uma2 family endonuclease [Dolichospermum sp. ST_sed1]MDD1426045.1 Uma2 family endonuclease [Dolichospermum sp. ST_sed9]MDD1438948.1 Uma2 family endonuclease [Dolichospermum sp. ST_sed3]MDD1453625.1 Uma2 family endonuclease [Dolichospermum sp. ST_sed7]MDD1459219.1 Uma2 family endonuclease [Dolichospermum sp. ST_sed2]MDD1463875.1 Uma2 family endonuclease [Dolichospermum sp. ST_sed5]MDD1472707.1 Uma2 family endonuclease [Dolichospermum sp. ST_sed4]
MYQHNPPLSPKETMPTMYDLPSELIGESGLPDEFHCIQADLLSETCQPVNYSSEEMLLVSDLNIYYDPRHPGWYKRPDWYMVLGIPNANHQEDLRLSYVVWQEGINPFLVVELLSPGTEQEDLGQTLREVNKPPTKWEVYEHILRVPYYIIYDRYQHNFRVFKINGTRYEAISLPDNRFWLEEIEMGLGLWQGSYQNTEGLWLRWYNADGWLPTLAEKAKSERQRAENESQRAENERQRAENERQRADKLAQYLRSLGVDPDTVIN